MKEIPKFPKYFATEEGTIIGPHNKPLKPGSKYSPAKRIEFQIVSLSQNGKKKSKTVHSLIARAYLGPRPLGMEVAHNDGDPTNNKPSNLRYATSELNDLDKLGHGTMYPTAKLKEPDVLELREIFSRIKTTDGSIPKVAITVLAAKYKVSEKTIRNAGSGITFKHI